MVEASLKYMNPSSCLQGSPIVETSFLANSKQINEKAVDILNTLQSGEMKKKQGKS
jgi:hypothetical protein